MTGERGGGNKRRVWQHSRTDAQNARGTFLARSDGTHGPLHRAYTMDYVCWRPLVPHTRGQAQKQ